MQYSAGNDRTVKYPRTVKYKKGRTGKLFQDSKVQDRIGQVSEVLQVSDLLPVSKVQDRTCRQSAFGQLSTGKAFEVLHESELQDRTGQAKTGLDRLVMYSRTMIFRTGQIRMVKYCRTGRIPLEWQDSHLEDQASHDPALQHTCRRG